MALAETVEQLRQNIAAGRTTRAEAIRDLVENHRLTEAGATDLLDTTALTAMPNNRTPTNPPWLVLRADGKPPSGR
ncbi:hypothetical protein GCM10027160_24100 [Streptomyces calidiresistens]|uniref:Uncharacterized protein n=1 Tax=Streptomyces calidiresistens TaxID=1485586 RepID=A0A7W3T467_9ACTN|nr:hypothetical protein [Streptomyces calidiresistens]MBB0230629.1 hypothetical protein [Streptomyces calidiresistens]